MKKEYSFNYTGNKYVILDKNNGSKEIFSIDAKKLQFDTLSFYEALFEDIHERIEINIEYGMDNDSDADEKIEKSSKYIFETVKSLTSEICDKLNSECFTISEDKK